MNHQDNIFNLNKKKSTSSKHINPLTISKSTADINATNFTSNLNYPFQLSTNPLIQSNPIFLQKPVQSNRIECIDPIVVAQNNASHHSMNQAEESVVFANPLALLPDSNERVFLPSACSSIQVYYPTEKYIFFYIAKKTLQTSPCAMKSLRNLFTLIIVENSKEREMTGFFYDLNLVLMQTDIMAKINSMGRLNRQWLLFIGFDSVEKFSSYEENLLSLDKIAENSQSNEEFFPLIVDLDSRLIYRLFMENLEEREYYQENYAFTNIINTSSNMESNSHCKISYDPRNLDFDVEMN
jgi:hypothetical protein